MNLKKIVIILVPVFLIGTGFYMKNIESGNSFLVPAILESLKNYHYNPVDINDEFSKKVFDGFLNVLDGNKRFFTQEDLKQLSDYKTKIDDLSKEGNYAFFDKTMEIYEGRLNQNQQWCKEILSNTMEFTSKESFVIDDKQPFAKNDVELKERVRKSLKYSVMIRLSASLDAQESAIASKDTVIKILSKDTLEVQARRGVLKSQSDFFTRWRKVRAEEKLSYYINAITAVFDPHTNYFPPADKANFDISMSGRLEGIGAQLQEKDGYIKVTRIVPGSPSALQGELKEGDIFLKVAQGLSEPIDVVNMPIDDAIKMIRGPKGTEVRLTIKKPDGIIKVIKIIRDIVILEETFAKSVVMEDNDHKKTGYIYLPTFYTDMNGNGGRTSWDDVKNEINKLKKAGIGRLVFDLRNNGGGSLQDVVTMSGLFIEKGPIVQVKSKGAEAEFLEDYDPSVEWDGPLVLMVNQYSASASEIIAAAMQDYKRGVIIGSNHTFGKGTVQRFVDLNQVIRSKEASEFGSLKITIQKFYRIDGGATQLRGVTPDIELPDNFTYLKSGESEQDFPMTWDKIEAASYKSYDRYASKLAKIKSNSADRIKTNALFNVIDDNAKRIKIENDKIEVSLNLDEYRTEEKLRKIESKKLDALNIENTQLRITTLDEDKKDLESDKGKSDRAKEWYKALKKDPYLFEALQVAEEL